MRYQEVFLGTKDDFGKFVRKAIPDLFAGNLIVEGQPVELPTDADIDYKIKYDDDVEGGSITIKASWDKDAGELSQED